MQFGSNQDDHGNHILYKKTLPTGFLDMVDDVVGVTEVGFKASELNSVINVTTAEKTPTVLSIQVQIHDCGKM